MDNRAIGVFDSGLGGLTAVRALRSLLPGDDIIYLGDTARAPYGTRCLEELREIAASDMAFMSGHDVKAVLVACGTISSNCLDTVRDCTSAPVLGVVHAAALEAVKATKTGRIGVLATMATANSGAFERELHILAPEATVKSVGTSSLVPLVEAGRVNADDAELMRAVNAATAALRESDVDTLILGCTHFPLLSAAISRSMGKDVVLIDSGAAAAAEFAGLLSDAGLLAARESGGTDRYYTSGKTERFSREARLFLGHDVSESVFGAIL